MSLIDRLYAWVHSAPLKDVVGWIAPTTREALNGYLESPHERESEWAWIADRFTQTYLSTWRPSSVREEWLYVAGRRVAPLTFAEMSTRRIPELDLARILADEKCEDDEDDHEPAPQYVSLALKLLEDGHRETAATMFEAADAVTPQNGEILNNWAFCLIPDDPEKALDLLDRAILLGMGDAHTTVANKLYCCLRLERYSTGLAYAEEVLPRWASLIGGISYMWQIDGDPVIVRVRAKAYTLDVIEAIAEASGDPVVRDDWAKRLATVRSELAA
jgi:tetratricopeptide (TPR) repeat protein